MAQSRIPWAQIKELMNVVHVQYKVISQFEDNVEQEHMPADVAETLFVNPLTKLHSSLSKILRDNKVLSGDGQQEQLIVAKMVDSMLKVQNELNSQSNSQNIKILPAKMTNDIKEVVGGSVSDETDMVIN